MATEQTPKTDLYTKYLDIYAKAVGNCLDHKDFWSDSESVQIAIAYAMYDAKLKACAPRSRKDLETVCASENSPLPAYAQAAIRQRNPAYPHL